MAVLDHNQTHLGRRILYNLLQNPMLNATEINIYYDMVEEMSSMVDKEPLWMLLDKQLKELADVGRLQRKLEIKLINPKELVILYKTYIKVITMYITILNVKAPVLHSQLFTPQDVNEFNSFITRFGSMINFDALECCHIDTMESGHRFLEFIDCPIKSGIYHELDAQAKLLVTAENNLQTIVDHLNSYISNSKGKKIEFKTRKKQGAKKQDPSGILLTTTVAKATLLLSSPIDRNLCGNISAVQYTTADKIITSDKIANLCDQIDKIRTSMRQYLLSVYESIIEEMTTRYNFFVPVANLIGKIDLVHTYASIAHKYNYYRPQLVNDDCPVSYLEAKEIRHPIIERIIEGAYVTNDVLLGRGSNESGRSNGMILYGLNQSGKTSLAKAIALIIIMAQIGCYVPGKLKYKPYSKIITRLSGNDNIFSGQSTFVIEMTELRSIIRQADQSTLVLGDELTKGTESSSGTAITLASIKSLIKKQSTFIFSTHMHHLVDMPYIAKLDPTLLNISHLAVFYDQPSDNLIYNRKLQTGSGSAIYGLTVVKSGFTEEFLNDANEVLLYLGGDTGNILDLKTSRYNSKVYMDSCAVCKKTKLQTELQSHHIEHQERADNRNLIGNMHKNVKNNLIVLCKDCHTDLHKQKLEFESLAISGGHMVRLKPEST